MNWADVTAMLTVTSAGLPRRARLPVELRRARSVALIPSLIQLRPPGFTWSLSAVPPQVADGDDPQ